MAAGHDSSRRTPLSLLREFSVPLIVGVAAALLWANVAPGSYHHFIHEAMWGVLADGAVWGASLHFWTNEVFMVFFFGLAAVEIVDSFLPGGHLNPPRKAVSPLLATAGGILGPALTFLLLNRLFGGPQYARGWGITTATDIALAWLVARMVFGRGHPAISFLLVLAVADDAIGLAIIAIFYPDPAHPVALWPLLLVAGGMAIAGGLRRGSVNNYWPYLLLAGTLSWYGLYLAHLHPALALVFVVPFMPHTVHATDETTFDLHPDEPSALSRFEQDWKVIVDFGLLLFGLANAGVQVADISVVTWLIFISLVAGKTIGIVLLAQLGRRLGYPLPERIGMPELVVIGIIAGIGLTVALFVASAAFSEPATQAAAKMGALFSALAAPIAIVVARLLGVRPRREAA